MNRLTATPLELHDEAAKLDATLAAALFARNFSGLLKELRYGG